MSENAGKLLLHHRALISYMADLNEQNICRKTENNIKVDRICAGYKDGDRLELLKVGSSDCLL